MNTIRTELDVRGIGSVSPRERDPRVYTKSEKAQMLENQNGKCAGCSESVMYQI